MDFIHEPVLKEESIDLLSIKPDGKYLDATIGGGGHASLIASKLSEKGMLIGIDQDEEAILHLEKKFNDLKCKAGIIIKHGNFRNMDSILKDNGIEKVDGIIMDLGVSSYQLDNEMRGFSYRNDAPLDMRMDKTNTTDAKVVVNTYSEKELERIIFEYGEERWASRIAGFIARERRIKDIETTCELEEIIKKAIPAAMRRTGPHPARRTFQAIRIEVNNELEVLKEGIRKSLEILNPGGRLCIITFHSLEDRIVKDAFRDMENPCQCPKEFPVCICGRRPVMRVITKKPIIPSDREMDRNSRARSAKLRVAEMC